jgi:hypothetical protein
MRGLAAAIRCLVCGTFFPWMDRRVKYLKMQDLGKVCCI